MLDRVAHLCIREAGWRIGLVAADSTGVETDRYEVVVKPSRRKRCFEAARRIIHPKYHITAIIDHLIILKAKITSYRCSDSQTLISMLKGFKAMRGSIFNADRAYDAEYIFKHIYKLGMKPSRGIC
jgi:hypothetical protein